MPTDFGLMSDRQRIERVLNECLGTLESPATPTRLREAIGHAVVPGGSRLRPRLCLAVTRACGDGNPQLADAGAAAIELLHCASLVHDDLPCFDDAPLRRGRASVHAAHGEEMAVLAGDGLIVMAFETIARLGAAFPDRLGSLVLCFADAAGPRRGLVSGQAWESEPRIGLRLYHQAKTAALFEAAARAGALAAGADADDWSRFGARVGEAYQVFDDLRDTGDACERLDKPLGQDEAHGRPNAALHLGADQAVGRLEQLLAEAVAALPPCRDRAPIDEWLSEFSARLSRAVQAQGTSPGTAQPEFLLAAGLDAGG